MVSIFFVLFSSFILFNDKVDANKFSSIFATGALSATTSLLSSLIKISVKKFRLSNVENRIGLKITFFFYHHIQVK